MAVRVRGRRVADVRCLPVLVQALKPQWPADDCYHGCCNGETAPSVPAVAASRKGLAGKATAAKEAAKEVIKSAEDAAVKASHPARASSCSTSG